MYIRTLCPPAPAPPPIARGPLGPYHYNPYNVVVATDRMAQECDVELAARIHAPGGGGGRPEGTWEARKAPIPLNQWDAGPGKLLHLRSRPHLHGGGGGEAGCVDPPNFQQI